MYACLNHARLRMRNSCTCLCQSSYLRATSTNHTRKFLSCPYFVAVLIFRDHTSYWHQVSSYAKHWPPLFLKRLDMVLVQGHMSQDLRTLLNLPLQLIHRKACLPTSIWKMQFQFFLQPTSCVSSSCRFLNLLHGTEDIYQILLARL